MNLNITKYLLLIAIFLSYLPILVFQNYSDVQSLLFWGGFIGLTGVVTLSWQFLLGVRGLVSRVVPDLFWVNKVHKYLGIYGITILLTHPVFMVLAYNEYGVNLLSPTLETDFDKYLFFGKVASAFLGFNWFMSVFFRKIIPFRWWKKLHFVAYIVLPLSLVHGFNLGTNLSISESLQYYWYILALVYLFVVIYRLAFRLGLFRYSYEVTDVEKITDDVVRIKMKPLGDRITPKFGQFIYFQRSLMTETHPFTVSHYDVNTGEISISPKSSGPFSSKLQKVQLGEKVILDGSYGVFTQEIEMSDEPIVLIAGGIGITPFLWTVEKVLQGWDRETILFYTNKTEKDIAYYDLIEKASRNKNFKLVNVLSRQEDYVGEKGHVDLEMIKKYLGEDLSKYSFYISGPPAMVDSLQTTFVAEGLPNSSIKKEKFSL